MLKKSFWFFLLFLFSCEQQVEVDLPEHENRLTANCFFTRGKPFEVQVTSSSSLLNSDTDIREDALVLIGSGNSLQDTLKYTGEGMYASELPVADINGEYTLSVSCPGYPDVTASSSIPSYVPMTVTSIKRNLFQDENGDMHSAVTLAFQDPPGEENYYEILIVNYIGLRLYIHCKSNDTLITREGDMDFWHRPGTTLFRDTYIDGMTYELELSFYSSFTSEDDPINYHLEFRSVSKELYNYKKRLIRHLENQYSDIWEGVGNPLPMYTNIENGYGVFAGYSACIDTLR